MSAPPNLLVLQAVHAKDTAGPRGRARGSITALSMALGQGIHAALGAPDDGTLALLDVVTGARAPIRGKVLVDGRDPARSSQVRARIGALVAEPRLPPAPSVGAAIRLALRARGEDGHRIDAVLDPLGLSGLHARKPASLTFAEARAVELALALTTPAPILLALHEPLCDVAIPNLHLVRERLREIAAARACVLITTSSPADARTLADRIHILHKGFLVREVSGDGKGLLFGAAAELTAWLSPAHPPSPEGDSSHVRALAAALSRGEGVHGVSWEDARSPGSPGAGAAAAAAAKVVVRGDSAEACAAALTDASLETGVLLEAIATTSPPLTEVRAATDTLLRMRFAPASRGLFPGPAPIVAVAPVPAAAPAPESAPAPAPEPEELEPPRSVPILPAAPTPPPASEGES